MSDHEWKDGDNPEEEIAQLPCVLCGNPLGGRDFHHMDAEEYPEELAKAEEVGWPIIKVDGHRGIVFHARCHENARWLQAVMDGKAGPS